MTLLALRDADVLLPAAALIMYWFDPIIFDGASYTSRAESDPAMSLRNLQICAGYYFDPAIAELPASPLNQNLAGLPALFIMVGGREVILSDSTRLAERAAETGVDVTLEVRNRLWHSFHFMAAFPEMAEAVLCKRPQYLRV